jgi:hypothetical protein
LDLELESGTVIPNVLEQDLAVNLEREDFAILSQTPQTYLQCAKEGGGRPGYALEYQDGAVEEHYEATGGPISLDRIVSAFVKYLRRDASWRTDFHWEKVDL